MNANDSYEAFELQKPSNCPQCSGKNILRIHYGLPGFDLAGMIKRKEAVSGGCLMDTWLPDWQCQKCRHKWFVADDPAKQKREATLEQILSRRRTAK